MSEKVLLVDDEPGIRKVLGLTFADMGFHLFTAENGISGLEIFKKELPSIVFTDIKMPGMDGIEFLRRIKHHRPDTEVIMISGHGDMDLAIKSLKLEACDFITKPINNDVLDIALRRATEKIAMRRQLQDYTNNLETLVAEKTAKLIEIERATAVNQAVEGLSSAMSQIADDMEGGIRYFNEMPCFVAIHEPALTIVAVNQLYAEWIGDRVGQVSGSSYRCNEKGPETCPVAKTFASGKGQRSKETIEYRNGSEGTVMVHTAPIRNSEGRVELVVEISVDITEIRRLKEELKASQQRYQRLFDAAPCYITVQNRDFQIIDANREFKAHFDLQNGAHCYLAYKERDLPCEECPVAETFHDGRLHQAEMVVMSKTGDPHDLLVQTAPLFDSEGQVFQVIEMSTDITQIRRLQDNLSGLGLMVGEISHSIKGVLTGLDAGLHFLESGMDKNSPDQLAEGVETIRLMVDRIRNVVLNILSYAKDRKLQSTSVNVLGFLEDIKEMVQTKINGLPIEWVCEFGDSMGDIRFDAVMIQTALINVLENAVEACVADTSQSSHRIRMAASRPAGTLNIVVDDNGLGMEPETVNRIFNLFYTSKGHSGTGLGMFIARNIIQRHGGKIDVASSPGKGSRFQISLPQAPPADESMTWKGFTA